MMDRTDRRRLMESTLRRAEGGLARANQEMVAESLRNPGTPLREVLAHYAFLTQHAEARSDMRSVTILVVTGDSPDPLGSGSAMTQTHPGVQVVLSGWRSLERAVARCTGELTVVMDERQRLLPHAAAEIDRAMRADLLYFDTISAAGAVQARPGWSPVLEWYSHYVGDAFAVRTAGLREVLSDLRHRTWQGLFLQAVRTLGSPQHLPRILGRSDTVAGTDPAAVRADLEARGATVRMVAEDPIELRADSAPRISIIIPSRDNPDLLSRCLTSIERLTDYPDFEILVVDNGSVQPGTEELYGQWGDEITLLRDDGYFNFARLCQGGAAAANGDVLLFLNDDTEVLSADWLTRIVTALALPGVGVAGAQLLFPDGRIQHAGIMGAGDHGFEHRFFQEPTDPLLRFPHEALAVTGACFAVGARLFAELDGFDRRDLPNAGGDVDFCLRARAQGLSTVLDPGIRLVHHESASRERRFESHEQLVLRERWPRELYDDPFVNPRLSRRANPRLTANLAEPIPPNDVLEGWWRAAAERHG